MARWAQMVSVVVAAAGLASAQPKSVVGPLERQSEVGKAEGPHLAAAVRQLLEQDFLSEPEKQKLRVRHGVWTAEDLLDEGLRASAAVLAADWEDPSLSGDHAEVMDRAEAKLRLGRLADVLELTAKPVTLRGARLRAQALHELGRNEDAIAALGQVELRLRTEKIADADELTEGVRGLALLTRLRGPAAGAADFRSMMAMLARARNELDPLCWKAFATEAELLWEKDNPPEAVEAAQRALELCPGSAEVTALLGRMSVDAFDVPKAEMLAERLDALANSVGGERVARSALAAAVIARMRIRQSDATGAMAVLDGVLAMQPVNRELLALRAAATAAGFDFDGARERLASLDELSPGWASGPFEVGKALSSARQYGEAGKYLAEAVGREPSWAAPVIELGLMLMQAGEDAAAEEALTKATALDPFNVRAANSLVLATEIRSFASVQSEHFTVRYKPAPASNDGVLAGEMLPVLERIHARVAGGGTGGIDHQPSGRTVIELMPDHKWFAVRITGMPGVHTIAASTGPVIAMESPRAGPGHMVGPYDWARVVQHEYTHTVTLSRTRNRLPHWFTEASAVYMEDSPRDYSAWQVLARAVDTDGLFDLEEINIAFIRPRRPNDRSQAYAQGAWMYEFIIERFGAGAPLDLMDRYASGLTEEQAFENVLKLSRAGFLEQFKAWAEGDLRRVGMRTSEGVPSVPELVATETPEGREAQTPTVETVAKWLEAHPEHAGVLELAVELALEDNGGEPSAEMVPLIERYANARPVDPMPHKLLASLYLDGPADDPERGPRAAIPHLEFLDVREQHSVAYAAELARRYAATGDWSNATEKAERATRLSPFDPAARELAASVAVKRGDFDTAERHIRALMSIEPDKPVHEQRLAAVGRMRGR